MPSIPNGSEAYDDYRDQFRERLQSALQEIEGLIDRKCRGGNARGRPPEHSHSASPGL